jgi:hypothetical protein
LWNARYSSVRKDWNGVNLVGTQKKWLWAVGILAAGAALLAFGVPAPTVLILGLVLLCPLMMFFMMGGKNTHEGSKKDPSSSSDTPRDDSRDGGQ